MNFMPSPARNILASSLLLFLSACATPPETVTEVSRFLRGECLALFTSERIGGYQHVARVHIQGKAVFALAEERGIQKCAMARSNFDLPNQGGLFTTPGEGAGWEQLEAIAISRCEQLRSAVTVPCKIFARNNQIVWTRGNEVNFK